MGLLQFGWDAGSYKEPNVLGRGVGLEWNAGSYKEPNVLNAVELGKGKGNMGYV